jgi:Cdc6-like AAA superfamily ATPase
MIDCQKERDELLCCLKNAVSVFVCGPQGSCKTTLIKSVAEEVNAKLGQAVYIDCSLYQTANAVLREILIDLGSVIASKSNYELTKRLKEKTRKIKLFVFLDHFENLKKHDILSVLFGLDFCVCIVSDSPESYRIINPSIRVKFAGILKIERLSDDQILKILAEKAEGKTSEDLIQAIVEKSQGNLTFALNALKSVEINHGKRVNLEEMSCNAQISEDHSTILNILRQKNKMPSGELYGLYCQRSELVKGERSFRNYMQALCRQGLVKSIGDKRGRSYELVEPKELSNG